MKKTRRGFAIGSSQRNRMTLMFGAARCWRPGLNASRSFEFRITPRGMRDARRHLMRHKCFKQRWISECASHHADQALEAPRFFAVIGTPEAATCLRFAATRLKFAARPVNSTAGRRS
jgi:hypothetical protein